MGGDVSYYLEYYDGTYRSNLPMKEYNVLRTPKFNMPSQIKNIKRYVSDKILTFNAANVQYWNLIDTNRPNLPSAVVMRDSYSTQMYDILAERFDVTCYKDMWSITTNPYDGDISYYKPDYVIYIIVERNLNLLQLKSEKFCNSAKQY